MRRLAALAALLLLLTGCCSTVVRDCKGDPMYSMDSHGFLRDAEASIERPDGTKIYMRSTSATAGILSAINGLMGTLVKGAENAKP